MTFLLFLILQGIQFSDDDDDDDATTVSHQCQRLRAFALLPFALTHTLLSVAPLLAKPRGLMMAPSASTRLMGTWPATTPTMPAT